MVRKQVTGFFLLLATLFPARLTFSNPEFPLSVKIPVLPKKVLKRLPLFSHKVAASVYYPENSQTDSSPLITADGSHINRLAVKDHRWIAVSRNLLKRWGGKIQYGDTLEVSGISEALDGQYIVHDTMNRRLKNTIDLLVGREDKIYGHWKNVHITKFETVMAAR